MNLLQNLKPEIPPDRARLARLAEALAKRAKGGKLFLLVALVAVVISVAGILLLRATQPSPPIVVPQPSPIPSETAQWNTYHNSAYNFSVDYPASWDIGYYPSIYSVETTDLIVFHKFGDRLPYDPEQVTVGIYADLNENGLPLKDFILKGNVSIDYPLIIDFLDRESALNHRKERVQEMEETTFQGFEALQDGENRLLINTGTVVFVFYIDSVELYVDVKDRKIFDQILSTFRFFIGWREKVSIDLPENWVVEGKEIRDNKVNRKIVARVHPDTNYCSESSRDADNISTEKKNIGGFPFTIVLTRIDDGHKPLYMRADYCITQGNNSFTISFFDYNNSSNKLTAANAKLFDQILSTFRFIE